MTFRRLVPAALAAFALAGCPSKQENPKPDFTTDVKATPRAPLAFASPAACALDSDCKAGTFCFQGGCARQCAQPSDCGAAGATCSERGRCLGGGGGGKGGGAGDIDVEPGTALTALPARVQQVAAGTDALKVQVKVAPAIAAGVLSYRIERTDGLGDPQKVRQASGSTDFELEVESGMASPGAAEPKDVEVYVITSAGAFRLSLIPQLPLSGYYAGQAKLDQFGQTGIPLDFYLVTNPTDASLSQATEAFVVLPVGPEKIFSPHPKTAAAGTAETMTRKLTWEGPPVNRWVAVFVSEFDLGTDSVVAAAGLAGQVRRTLRLEVEPFGTSELIGKISDRWTGLYDARPDLGPRAPANVVFEGAIDLRRSGPAPLHTEINPPETVNEGDPKLLPVPALGDCSDTLLAAVPAITLGAATYGCDTTKTVAGFKAATTDLQASCAIALARESLKANTTAGQIAAFLDNTNPGGESFADFMERCAAGTGGACRPTPAVLCGRELAAYAYAGLEQDLPSTADLVVAFQDASREAFLGRQMGAFHTDAQTRLDWLKTSDYPAIVTSAVKDLIDRLLREWTTNVLDVHLGVLGGQFDDAGLAVLSHAASGADAVAARKTLLLEMSQSWRGAADALTLAAARWNQLYQDDATRKAKAALVSGRMFDLYLVAGLLTNFNRDSGASFASGTFAAGFAQLMRDLGALMQPFDKLVYARDAEVVVSTSVDPASDNTTLLQERREAAKAEITSAAEAVGQIIAEAQSEALSQAELTNKMNNEINDVRAELVELCGLPTGCTASTAWSDPTCLVRTGAGRCGFLIDHETSEVGSFDAGAQSVSEAGSRLLDFRGAILAYNRAQEELRAHNASGALALEATEAFALQVEAANTARLGLIDQMNAAIAQQQADRTTSMGKLLENLAQRNTLRRENIAGTQAAMAEWGAITVGGINSSFRMLQSATALGMTAEGLYRGAESRREVVGGHRRGLPQDGGHLHRRHLPRAHGRDDHRAGHLQRAAGRGAGDADRGRGAEGQRRQAAGAQRCEGGGAAGRQRPRRRHHRSGPRPARGRVRGRCPGRQGRRGGAQGAAGDGGEERRGRPGLPARPGRAQRPAHPAQAAARAGGGAGDAGRAGRAGHDDRPAGVPQGRPAIGAAPRPPPGPGAAARGDQQHRRQPDGRLRLGQPARAGRAAPAGGQEQALRLAGRAGVPGRPPVHGPARADPPGAQHLPAGGHRRRGRAAAGQVRRAGQPADLGAVAARRPVGPDPGDDRPGHRHHAQPRAAAAPAPGARLRPHRQARALHQRLLHRRAALEPLGAGGLLRRQAQRLRQPRRGLQRQGLLHLRAAGGQGPGQRAADRVDPLRRLERAALLPAGPGGVPGRDGPRVHLVRRGDAAARAGAQRLPGGGHQRVPVGIDQRLALRPAAGLAVHPPHRPAARREPEDRLVQARGREDQARVLVPGPLPRRAMRVAGSP
ncbi:MAG: hypothetical protein QM765_22520 [Myxococcales bacterium]